ncbi:phosphatase 2C-like domain-containing protein [Calycina marina]|uniref:Phosphatase 2C-like domain-containing protein n=1 Tax=Calycina marina TaxID=1763456 RepID=A0A9P7YXR4_9HELO|nr:phosphatase 2C-like domain-containing protein [Calycina marina]
MSLASGEGSVGGTLGKGVVRTDAVTLAANSPNEGSWGRGAFDGHNGSAVSHTLKESLIPYIARNISQLYTSFSDTKESPPPATVDVAIASTFHRLDADIMKAGLAAIASKKPFTEALSQLAPFFAGSCAIMTIFDPSNKTIWSACTGDLRAVLGRPSYSPSTSIGKLTYTAEALSTDQTGINPLELKRLAHEHPGEPNVVDPDTGRVLGIMITCAFGDGLWKWSLETIKKCRYANDAGAEGGFVAVASDGTWDHLSDEQVVGLVEMWLSAKREGMIGKGYVAKVERETARKEIWDGKVWNRESDWAVLDENCESHLMRNAWGGRDEERLLGIARAQPPFSRSIRDDVTVQVPFFDGVDV